MQRGKRSATGADSGGSQVDAVVPGWMSIRSQANVLTAYYYVSVNSKPSDLVAAFDLDGTIINTKHNSAFPVDAYDWVLAYDEAKAKLKELVSNGYRVVIFSNQKGVSLKHCKSSDIMKKIIDVEKELGIPLTAIFAIEEDEYRKPDVGMWTYFMNNLNAGRCDASRSFFCGDAAGRPADKSRKKDHSCADYKFALNVGIDFHVPEELFAGLSSAQVNCCIAFDVKKWYAKYCSQLPPIFEPKSSQLSLVGNLDLVVFVGWPGSGKTKFYRDYMAPCYVHVNRDTMSTAEKCMDAARKALSEGKSVVVDNTSPSREDRQRYVKIAQEFSIKPRCFYFNIDRALAWHMNLYRSKTSKTSRLSVIAFNMYNSKFQMPDVSEGFGEVLSINFVPNFTYPQERDRFLMHYE